LAHAKLRQPGGPERAAEIQEPVVDAASRHVSELIVESLADGGIERPVLPDAGLVVDLAPCREVFALARTRPLRRCGPDRVPVHAQEAEAEVGVDASDAVVAGP